MRELRAGLIRLAGLLRTKRREHEMEEELASHLELHIEDNLRAGMSPQEARRQALIKLGGLEQTREIYRDRRGVPIFETAWRDFRYGLRMLVKNPGFAIITVMTLALGIAANSTIFSLVSGWMLRPPNIEDPARVVAILTTDPARGGYGWDMNPVSPPDFVAWRDQCRSFAAMAASEPTEHTLTGEGEPERLLGLSVSANYFDLLGVDVALGRTFLPGEDRAGRARVVILSHDLWKRRFASDPAVIGKVVRLDGETYTVAAVMPSRFRVGSYEPQLWTPLALSPQRLLPAARANRSLAVLARLKSGVRVEMASSELATLAQRAEQSFPGTSEGWGARAMVLQRYLADQFKVGVGIQMTAVLFVLLIACANIASLQLTRATARRMEITVRTALGANRRRLVSQLLAESLLVALIGGGLGLLLAYGGVAALRRGLDWGVTAHSMANEIFIDPNVLAFTLGLSVLSALLFGLAPALHQTAGDLHSAFQEGGRTVSHGKARRRVQSILVTAQIALSLALLVGAGLFIWGFLYKIHAGLGIDPKQVLTANIRLASSRYQDASTQAAFFGEAIGRLEALPGVISAGGATTLVPVEQARVVTFSIEGQGILPRTERATANHFAISPRFLATLGVPVLRGRSFDLHDRAQAPSVAIVNEAFARRYLPNDDPLGKRVRLDTEDSERRDWSEIVGVVRNVEESYEEWEERPQVYEPYLQRPSASMSLVVRTTSAPEQFAPFLRRAIWSLDKDQPVHRVQTMEQALADYRGAGVLVITLMGSYAALALAMAMVGVFGVMAYTVAQRTHEIGIRMALGAGGDDVSKAFAKRGFALGAFGVGIGLLLAAPLVLLAPRAGIGMPLEQRLGVALAASVLIWLSAVLASYIPVRRATRVDPTVALRYE